MEVEYKEYSMKKMKGRTTVVASRFSSNWRPFAVTRLSVMSTAVLHWIAGRRRRRSAISDTITNAPLRPLHYPENP